MDEQKLIELIYDKLADNDEREQFEVLQTEDMCIARTGAGDAGKIGIIIDGVEYVLSIEKHADDWEIYQK